MAEINGFAWRSYPMKPVMINNAVFNNMDKSNYTMEPKFDGHRIIAIATTNKIFTFTRQRNPLKLPLHLQLELNNIGFKPGTVLDGEIWSPIKRGGWDNLKPGECRITFWDVIRDGLQDISNQSIEIRRQVLDNISNTDNISKAQVYEVSQKNLQTLEQQAREVRDVQALRSGFIHGVVLKRNGSPRRDHACRSIEHPDWLKIVYQGLAGWEPR